MKVSELRIGNYTTDNVEIKIISAEDILYLSQNDNIHSCNAIPLTEEILKKCGLTYRNGGIGGQDQWAGYGHWGIDKDEFYLIGTKSGQIWFQRNDKWKIEYVHQLQNLYFSLTGDELKINL